MAEFSGTGAHLNSTELRAWTSLIDVSRIIDAELEADLVRNHNMTHREYEVLVRLDGAGGRARMSSLARQIEASAPLVTQTVIKLEERGWIDRVPVPNDRRGIDAVLTSAGRKALGAAAKPHAELVQALLTDVLGTKLDDVAHGLGEVADHLRLHRAGGACDDAQCPLHGSGTD